MAAPVGGPARADGWYPDDAVPPAVRTELDRLTVRVERDRRWMASGPQRRVPPAVALPPMAALGIVAVVSGHPGAIAFGVLLILVTAVLGFVPVRRTRRRRRLRWLLRRWSGHRVPRSALGARWHPALDALADAERWLRHRGLLEQSIAAGAELGLALERARSGTRVDAEIARVGDALGTIDIVDRDVEALRGDLARAVDVRERLLAANTGAAQRVADLAVGTAAELAARAAAVEAARERALGILSDAVLDAAALLPEHGDPRGGDAGGGPAPAQPLPLPPR